MLSEAVLSMIKNPTEEKIKKLEDRVEQKMRGIALQEIRESLGVSQDIFGAMLGVSEAEVAEMELGNIDKDQLQQIQETYRPQKEGLPHFFVFPQVI